jgi:hypothetical protein
MTNLESNVVYDLQSDDLRCRTMKGTTTPFTLYSMDWIISENLHLIKKLHPILMQYICAYKLAATFKMTLMYFLVNIHINNQSTLCKVNNIP